MKERDNSDAYVIKYSLKSCPRVYTDPENFFRVSPEGVDDDATKGDDKRRRRRKTRGWLAGVAARNGGGSREQQVVDAKERSTDVKSWGNKKVALILARAG